MRLLFVYLPPAEINDPELRVLPLGLSWLQAHMQKLGHECRIFNGALPWCGDLEETIGEFDPQILGFTLLSVNRREVQEALQRVRELAPLARILLGGPHVSGCFQSMETSDEWALADHLFAGPSEKSLADLVKELESPAGRAFPRVIHGTCDRSDLVSPASMGIACENVVTSSGCPGACIFCASRTIWGRDCSVRPAQSVIEEIRSLREMGVGNIVFSDDTFTYDMENLRAIVEGFWSQGESLFWDARTRADSITVQDISYMRSRGCVSLSFGIETASQELQQRIGKNIDLDRARHIVEFCADKGIYTNLFFVIGLPGETRETIEKNIQFIRETRPDSVTTHILHFLPGTPLEKMYGPLDWSSKEPRTLFFDREHSLEQLLQWQEMVEAAGKECQRQRQVDEYESLCREFPGQYDLHASLGDVLIELGQADQAMQVYKKSLECFPTPQVYIRTAELLFMFQKEKPARRELRKALDILMTYWRLGLKIGSRNAFLAGYCHELLGDQDQAAEWYESAMKLDSSTPEVFARLGWMLLQEGRDSQAVQCFLSVPAEDRMGDWYENICSAYLNLDMPQKADKELKRGLDTHPDDRDLRNFAISTGLVKPEQFRRRTKGEGAGRKSGNRGGKKGK